MAGWTPVLGPKTPAKAEPTQPTPAGWTPVPVDRTPLDHFLGAMAPTSVIEGVAHTLSNPKELLNALLGIDLDPALYGESPEAQAKVEMVRKLINEPGEMQNYLAELTGGMVGNAALGGATAGIVKAAPAMARAALKVAKSPLAQDAVTLVPVAGAPVAAGMRIVARGGRVVDKIKEVLQKRRVAKEAAAAGLAAEEQMPAALEAMHGGVKNTPTGSFDQSLAAARAKVGLPAETSMSNTRWDEGGPSPTIAESAPKTEFLARPGAGSPLEGNAKAQAAAEALRDATMGRRVPGAGKLSKLDAEAMQHAQAIKAAGFNAADLEGISAREWTATAKELGIESSPEQLMRIRIYLGRMK